MESGQRYTIELIASLDVANAAFSDAIAAAVPAELVVYHSKGNCEVGPTDPGYGNVRKAFVKNVSSIPAVKVLQFMYSVDRYLSANVEHFRLQYGYLGDDRLIRACASLPRLDQTTICKCLRGFSDTLVQDRLDDLERIGLLASQPSKPPFQKFIGITAAGITVIDTAAAAADAELATLAAMKIQVV